MRGNNRIFGEGGGGSLCAGEPMGARPKAYCVIFFERPFDFNFQCPIAHSVYSCAVLSFIEKRILPWLLRIIICLLIYPWERGCLHVR